MNKLVKYLCLVLPLLSGLNAYAKKQGQQRLDSLLGAMADVKDDKEKAGLLLEIAYSYKNVDPAKGITYGNEGLAIAKQINWQEGLGKAHNSLGTNYKASSDYPAALSHYLEALKVYEATNDSKNIPIILMNIGTVYRPMHEYAKALEYYGKALALGEKQDNKRLQAQLQGNMGVVCFEQEDYKAAVLHDAKALAIFEAIGDSSNIAWITSNMGDTYIKSGDPLKGIGYHQKAMLISKAMNDRNYVANNMQNIANAYQEMANTANAKLKSEYLQTSLHYLDSARAILIDLGDLDYLKEIYLNISSSLEAMGRHAEALDNYKQYDALKDSVLSADKRVAIAKLGMEKAEIDKAQQIKITELTNTKRRNETLLFVSGISLLLIVTGFVIKERRKSDKLLLNILPSEVAHELKQTGAAAAKHFNNVTVLFTDFVNFTTLAEKMQPQQLVDELHSCFKAFDAIITKYNIEKIKTVGDAYLAVSGLPIASAQHADDMIQAAMEIRGYMLERKKQLGDDTFDMRIGINSGSVVAGIVGVKKFAYDIWGDTVNIAARMEQSSEPGKINISQTTYELVKDNYTCSYRGEIEAKNKGRLRMYFVEQAS